MVGAFRPHVMVRRFYPEPLHNSLVQNSAVPILLVPSQMMPSELLSQSYIPQRQGKDSHTVCKKCGTSHAGPLECPAINRKCYHCRRYGHYANFCLSKKPHSPEEHQNVQWTKCEVQTDSSVAVTVPSNVTCDADQHAIEVIDEKISCKPREDIVDLQNKCADLENRNLELSEEIEQLQSSLSEMEQNTELLHSQLKNVFQACVSLNGACVEFEHLTEHLVDEFTTVAFMTAETGLGKYPCHRCTTFHLPRDTCPAKGHFCCRCGKRNHYAAACDSEILPACNLGEETEKLLETLENTLGITIGKEINCIQCDEDENE